MLWNMLLYTHNCPLKTFNYIILVKWNSSDSTVWLQTGQLEFDSSTGKDFTLHQWVYTGTGAHPATYPNGTGSSFCGKKSAGAWSWPIISLSHCSSRFGVYAQWQFYQHNPTFDITWGISETRNSIIHNTQTRLRRLQNEWYFTKNNLGYRIHSVYAGFVYEYLINK